MSDHIHWGQTTAVVGSSGAGKSTFLRLLNRFEDPTEGSILLDGKPLASYDVHALRRRVGIVAQRPTMLSETIGEEIRVARPELGDEAVIQLLERVGLPGVALDAATSTLSGGEQQWVALARTLALDRRYCCSMSPQVRWMTDPLRPWTGSSRPWSQTA